MRVFPSNADIFAPVNSNDVILPVKPVKPFALPHDQWPPDYKAVYAWRIKRLHDLTNDPDLLAHAKRYYSDKPAQFIMHWMDTYDPRKNNQKWMPFIFFWRQAEFIEFLDGCVNDGENGLTEKCRDAGVTWLACAYSVWRWLFVKDDAIGWGSRKEKLVDEIGNVDSIFEKMRMIIKRLPKIWKPVGFVERKHATYMKLINPENGSLISGEAGDNIGRGGRKKIYFKDESAHYERPEKIQAALDDNTNVQIDISSVNGLGNVFHRKREGGIDWQPGVEIEKGFTRVFIVDWSHHPEKTKEWYEQRKAKAEREGLQHVFAQEVDRNYSAAIQNTIISYEWIQAAVNAHLKIPCLRIPPPDIWGAALDVADEGADRNALAMRQWIIVRDVQEWGARDPGVTARYAIDACRVHRGIKVQYDNIGMGTNVKSEYNRLLDDKVITLDDVKMIGWNAGAAVINPYDRIIPDDEESLMNKDFFGNFKAQAWWSARTRFYKTWRAITQGDVYDPDELISLDGNMPLLHQLMKELAQPTLAKSSGLRTIVDKKPEGTKSPNLADAVIMCMFPAPEDVGVTIGGYSG